MAYSWSKSFFIITSLRLVSLATAQPPFILDWNLDRPHGPDGPWYAVKVTVGGSDLDLYPAGTFGSAILKSQYSASDKMFDIGFSTGGGEAISTNEVDNLLNATGSVSFIGDSMSLGPLRKTGERSVQNASIQLVDELKYHYPGKTIDASVGFLTTGATNDFQEFNKNNYSIPINGLQMDGVIASRTYGIHIGSAKLKQEPSLVYGGFDKSRIVGKPATFDTNGDGLLSTRLSDISIATALGESPFSFKEKKGLLVPEAASDNSGSDTLDIILSTGTPYLHLPRATCDEIASVLPVTFDETLGLYMWNTDNSSYDKIVNSPAYLSFDFDAGGGNTFPIKVPFKLLDLDLTSPLVTGRKAYFPCSPYVIKKTVFTYTYTLGRAFHQAAFVGMSWNTRKFWVAQAPGPKMGNQNAVALGAKDIELPVDSSFQNSQWTDTWDGIWTVTGSKNAGSDAIGSNEGSSQTASSSGGLSTGAKAGIGIGVAAVIGLLLIGIVVFYRKRRTQRYEAPPNPPSAEKGYDYVGGPGTPHGLPGTPGTPGHPAIPPVEADNNGSHQLHQLHSDPSTSPPPAGYYHELPAQNQPVYSAPVELPGNSRSGVPYNKPTGH